jgi:branched-chain amino acid transport system ATP-binding protein
MILEVQGVSKRFGGLQALTNVAFDLAEGHILGLIGPNGAGKTTLFNVINGVYKPDTGRIIFRGEDITGKPPYEAARRGLARTYQVVRPLQELTVRENVMVGACYGREKRHIGPAADIAGQVLETVGLGERADQLAGSLNVAQKKRLEMARTLAARPYLLLLDEVLAGLNPSEIAAMIETVQLIRNQGVTILMIEHVMQALMSLSDAVIVLDYGELIATGTPEEVVNNPQVIEAYLGDPKIAQRLLSQESSEHPE